MVVGNLVRLHRPSQLNTHIPELEVRIRSTRARNYRCPLFISGHEALSVYKM